MTRQAENRGSRVGLMPIGIGVPHRGKGNGLGNFSYIIPQFVRDCNWVGLGYSCKVYYMRFHIVLGIVGRL